jgi:hypothetical protein
MEIRRWFWLCLFGLFTGCGRPNKNDSGLLTDTFVLKIAAFFFLVALLWQHRAAVAEAFRSKLGDFLGTNPDRRPKASKKPNPVKTDLDTRSYSDHDDTQHNTMNTEQELTQRLYKAEQDIASLTEELRAMRSRTVAHAPPVQVGMTSDEKEAFKSELNGHISKQISLTIQENMERITNHIAKVVSPSIQAEVERKVIALVKEEMAKQQRSSKPGTAASTYVAGSRDLFKGTESKTTPQPTAPTPKPETIYASAPQGNLFHKFSAELRPFETLYIIQPAAHSPGTGTYTLVEHEATLDHAFSMIDILRDACDLLGSNEPTARTMHIRKAGTVEKRGDQWLIREKIQLDW